MSELRADRLGVLPYGAVTPEELTALIADHAAAHRYIARLEARIEALLIERAAQPVQEAD